MVNNWSNFIRSWLFPSRCRLCLASADTGLDLCSACLDELPWLSNTCRTCATPLADGVAGPCGQCLQNPPALDACHALFAYRPPVDRWIQMLKFHNDPAMARPLGELLARYPAALRRRAQWRLLAVPLHSRRLRQRGYNQSIELARPLLRSGFRKAQTHCARARHTAAQSSLSSDERRRNLRGAFHVRETVKDSHLLLIDDVVTSGTTLNELARALKAAGARQVEALVVARTISGDSLP